MTPAERHAQILTMLAAAPGPLDRHQLSEAMALHVGCVVRYLNQLRALKLVRISKWRLEEHGPHAPLYALGRSDDAPRPRRLSGAVKARNYRARRAMLRPRRNPLDIALFGPA